MNALVVGLPLSLLVGLIPVLPLIGSLANGFVAILCRSGRRPVPEPLVSLIGVVFPLFSFLLTCFVFTLAKDPVAGITTQPLWNWIAAGDFRVPIAFKADRLSLILSLVVTGVGSLIHFYSIGYMRGDRGFARYFSYLNLFLFAMLTLVLAENLPFLFIGWEGVGLCSYLLIGFWFEDPAKAYAAKKAFVVNRIGDLGFLIGMFLLYATLSGRGVESSGSLLSFDLLREYRGELYSVATAASLLLFLGAVGKSAQIPLYVWLPDAMAGPTPVSALIHAATMVTAGVYLVARLHFLFTLSPLAMQVVAVIGGATALFAATMAMTERDMKKILAYSTISQLGLMFLAVGVGAFAAAIFHLVTHAFFKACLFLGAGSVIHATQGEQDIWKMGRLQGKMPLTFFTFALAVLAIVGVAPFAGFFSKDAILFQVYATGHPILWGVGLVTAGCTSFYMCRLLALAFLGTDRLEPEKRYHLHESPWSLILPMLVLGLLSLVGGWIGIPEVFLGGDHFFRWLGPLFPYSNLSESLMRAGHGRELLLSIVTLVAVLHIGILTTVLYSQKPEVIARLARFFKKVSPLLGRKYYVDEIYLFLIVRPIRWFSEVLLWHFSDEKVVDGIVVNGSAVTVGRLGRALTLLQTGVVQHYALFFAVGALVLLVFFLM